MRKRHVVVALVCICLLSAAAGATHLAPALWNAIFQPTQKDLDLRSAPIVSGTPVQLWEVHLPWSETGLGGAVKFLGMADLGMPVAGGATAPERIAYGPGPLLAVEDRGQTRLFDGSGRLLAVMAGSPAGITDQGCVVTGFVCGWSTAGELKWERDPFAEAMARYCSDAKLQIISGCGETVVSPAGDIYCMVRLTLGTEVVVQSPYSSGETVREMRVVEDIQATVVYDQDGNLLACSRDAMPFVVFGAGGTAFTTAVSQQSGYAHREFRIRQGQSELNRTILLPSDTVYATTPDGMVCCLDGPRMKLDDPWSFTVYSLARNTGVRFTLPSIYQYIRADNQGYLYAGRPEGDGLTITAWKWPTP